jgi:adenylate kinase
VQQSLRVRRGSALNLVLMGPPGCGKGTQAARIATRYGIPHISTGDILRAAVREGSALGRQVEATLASGGLVSDDLITELVRDRLARPDVDAGFVLDGFPRTVAQAEALDAIPAAAWLVVVVIAVEDSEIVRRLATRRVCASCRLTQSVSSEVESDRESCPYCGGRLERRKDDDPETVRRRLETYAAFAAPVIAHYRDRMALASVEGVGQPEAVTAALCAHIDRFSGAR